jgi:hypothetical protein
MSHYWNTAAPPQVTTREAAAIYIAHATPLTVSFNNMDCASYTNSLCAVSLSQVRARHSFNSKHTKRSSLRAHQQVLTTGTRDMTHSKRHTPLLAATHLQYTVLYMIILCYTT